MAERTLLWRKATRNDARLQDLIRERDEIVIEEGAYEIPTATG
jgi:hypothetical protein